MMRQGVVVVEKLMSLTEQEYTASLQRLIGDNVAEEKKAGVSVAVGGGVVRIIFEALPMKKLGGLLELPQARVTLCFTNVSKDTRETFLRKFDLAFQRGGG